MEMMKITSLSTERTSDFPPHYGRGRRIDKTGRRDFEPNEVIQRRPLISSLWSDPPKKQVFSMTKPRVDKKEEKHVVTLVNLRTYPLRKLQSALSCSYLK